MELTQGYKKTEVGMLPEEWELSTLSDVVDFLDGKRRPVKDSDRAKMRGDFPYYGASGIVDYVNDFIFDDDLILLGEDGENILSRNCRLAFKVSGKIWVNNHAHVLKPKSETDIGYLTEYLESLDYEQYNSGTAQPKLNKKSCSNIPVVCPPLPEQRAIAAALSDVDALIVSLDQLTAKKRDIKQATMQELLTGKRRLPGFDGEWKVKRLSDLAQIISGGTPKTSNLAYWNGPVKWCTPTDITSCSGKYLNQTERSITSVGLSSCSARLLPVGSLLLCSRATIGEIRIAGAEISTNQGFKSLICKPDVHNDFLYYKLLTMKSQMIEKAIGSTFLEISTKSTADLSVSLPLYSEQFAIATILSDMDIEIETLEQKLEKTRLLKQGMMQELLTGKTRLL